MRLIPLLLPLTIGLTVNAQDKTTQSYRLDDIYALTDLHGHPQCCPNGLRHNGIACVPCEDPAQYFDPDDDACKDPKPCPPGQGFFFNVKECRPISECEPWGYFDGRGCSQKPGCPDHFYFDGTRCVPDECDDDEVWFQGRCELRPDCDWRSGEYYNPITNTCGRFGSCPPGQHWTVSGCVPNPGCVNPEHYYHNGKCGPCDNPEDVWNGSACVPKPNCPPGQYPKGSKCVDIPECGPGMFWNRKNNQCEHVWVCPVGQVFNGVDACIDIPYPPDGGPICFVPCENLPGGSP
ncbi:hypothetical protein BDV12DRAFT_189982 [Aspergillus spectabilis]